ncbi:MAG: hypothetical protein V2A77_09765 [Pseudomonadota bacterium]
MNLLLGLLLCLLTAIPANAWTIKAGFESGSLGAKAQGAAALGEAFSATTFTNQIANSGQRSCKITWPGPTISIDLQSVAYKWTASTGKAGEWYLQTAAGGDPGLARPNYVKINNVIHDSGFVKHLENSQWAWGDNDNLGYNAIYVKSDGTDPNTKPAGYIIYLAGTNTAWGVAGGIVTLPAHLPPGTELWARCYVYFDAGFIFASHPVSKFIRFCKARSNGSRQGCASIMLAGSPPSYEGEPFLDCEYTGDKCDINTALVAHKTGAPLLFETGRWYCVEQYLRFTADNNSVQRLWIDGVLIAEKTGFRASCDPNGYIDYVYLLTYWNGGAPRTQVEYWDDIVITNERPKMRDDAGNYMIGNDTQPPTPPSDIQVKQP